MPAIRNAVTPPEPFAVPDGADRGKLVYYRYGCQTCHGDSGLGQYDLRAGLADLPTDSALVAHIRNPEVRRPGTRMPTWEGVIAEDEYAALARYVRTLEKR